MIIWLGFDGFDYSFQIDYVSYWNRIVKAFRDVCDYSKVPVSIEYKPYEERVHAFIDSFGTAVSILHDADEEGESRVCSGLAAGAGETLQYTSQ